MAGLVIPSPVVAIIAWAKGNAALQAQFESRVAAELPDSPTFPFLTATRITGVPQLSELPMDFARIQFNIWGGVKANGKPDWEKADLPARVLEAEIRAFRGAQIGDAYISELAPYEGMQQLKDPDTNDARFWMDALVVVRRSDGQ